MLFGAIDVGTNSIHLIVVEFDSTFDTTRVVYKDREMVRLGSDDAMESGKLSTKAMNKAIEALKRFVAGARVRGAERLRAVATSAVREASNGDAFRAAVETQAGIPLEIVSAQEEARLIHLGVASGFPIYDHLACVIDIGGGSTEFIVGDGERPYLLDSVKLGSLRLYDQFLRGKSVAKGARELDKHILKTIAPLIDRVRRYRIDQMIGTSGTIMGLAAVDAAAQGITLNRVHGYTLTRERLEILQREMLQMSENERRKMPGMNPRRSDIIVAGNAILIAAMAQLGRENIIVCERALRDGIIVDMVSQDRALADRLGDERVRRIEAIEGVAHHYAHLGGHQRHVARLAIALFERLAGLHGLAPSDRDMLYAAAILHSIGRFVALSGHHKHSAYLIRNSELRGWRDDERELIAQVARYYRKAMPKPSHPEFAALSPADQHRVEVLASILRIAEGLDERELGVVGDVNVRRDDGRVTIVAQAEGNVAGELGAAMFKADLFERTFGVRAAFESVLPDGRL
jgi:exopolyphosphatase/guanosine-5'-triphosphate,3'-diphosphate pyrophosphatase